MTDRNREELIEKAAKALTGLTDAEWEVATVEGTDHLTGYFEAAERVWAVFEQAHAPTGDEEPEWEYECRIPPFGWETCTDDPRFCPRGSERRRRKAGPWVPVEQGDES